MVKESNGGYCIAPKANHIQYLYPAPWLRILDVFFENEIGSCSTKYKMKKKISRIMESIEVCVYLSKSETKLALKLFYE
jgi:hypothetical protein